MVVGGGGFVACSYLKLLKKNSLRALPHAPVKVKYRQSEMTMSGLPSLVSSPMIVVAKILTTPIAAKISDRIQTLLNGAGGGELGGGELGGGGI